MDIGDIGHPFHMPAHIQAPPTCEPQPILATTPTPTWKLRPLTWETFDSVASARQVGRGSIVVVIMVVILNEYQSVLYGMQAFFCRQWYSVVIENHRDVWNWIHQRFQAAQAYCVPPWRVNARKKPSSLAGTPATASATSPVAHPSRTK